MVLNCLNKERHENQQGIFEMKQGMQVKSSIRTLALLTVIISATITGCSDSDEGRLETAKRHQVTYEAYFKQGQFRAALVEARNIIQATPKSSEGYLAMANIYLAIGAHQNAIELLNESPEGPDVSLTLAEAYIETGKLISGLKILEAYPQVDGTSDNIAALLLKAKIHLKENDQESLFSILTTVKEYDPDNPDLKILDAKRLFLLGDIQAATETLNNILVENPNHIEALITHGSLALNNNDLAGAEKSFSTALANLPQTDLLTVNRTIVLSNLTKTLTLSGRTSEAMIYQKILAEANPEAFKIRSQVDEARELFQLQKYSEAESILIGIKDEFGLNTQSGLLLGLVQYKQGFLKEAGDLFFEFIDTETAPIAFIQTAAIAKLQNNPQEAVAMLKDAVSNHPNDASVLATYGVIALQVNNKDTEAALALEKSLSLKPKQAKLRVLLAKHHLALGNSALAEAHLRDVYESNPLSLTYQQAYIGFLLSSKNWQAAEAVVSRLTTEFSSQSDGHLWNGFLNLAQEKSQEAEEAFTIALNMNDSNLSYAYIGLAQTMDVKERPLKSLDYLEKAIDANPKLFQIYDRIVRRYHSSDLLPRGIEFFTQIRESNTELWEPSIALSQLYLSSDSIEKALQMIENMPSEHGNKTAVKVVKALALDRRAKKQLNEGKLTAAHEDATQAFNLNPNNQNYLITLIRTEIKLSSFTEAKRLIGNIDPSAAMQYPKSVVSAELALARQQPEEAIQHYEAAWQSKPHTFIGTALFALYNRVKDREKAEQFLSDWKTALPEDTQQAMLSALDQHQKGNIEGAIEAYKLVLAVNSSNVVALNNLAYLYLEQGSALAEPTAHKAFKLAPENPSILDTYGWILVKAGRVSEGFTLLEKARSLNPDDSEIAKHLSEAKALK